MKIIAEYIWLDHTNQYRSKTKIFDIPSLTDEDTSKYLQLNSYSVWNYDGSSTGDIPENDEGNTECLLYPIALFDDPFNKSTDTCKYMLVLCNNSYILNNIEYGIHKYMFSYLDKITKRLQEETYMFGFEQEFFMIDITTGLPLGIECFNEIIQGDYYCGNGSYNVKQRQYINDTQYKLINAGINLTGFNYEVAPGQAEFQVCDYEIDALYQLLMLRFILIRNAERYNIHISFDNVISNSNNINNTGCHTNISNAKMREHDGIKYIMEYIDELGNKTPSIESKFNEIFGECNTERLNGKLETSKWNIYSYGYGTRHTSIRIPNQVVKDGYGYFEDRRPGGNMNPFNYVYHLLF